ncbi:MAG: hypothetical protein JKX73_00935 [Flavobacteriales bacterium]|nr:hypothetical protein [Flavobacteriales bacterium]
MQSLQELFNEEKELKNIDSNIKAAIAETIIRELFINMGFEVHRYGMEYAVPGFGSRNHPIGGQSGSIIRLMPDFAVTKNDQMWFLEVKYRASGEFDLNKFVKEKNLPEYPYPDALILLLTPDHIKVQTASVLAEGGGFVFLNEHSDLSELVDRSTIKAYVRSCWKYFETK